MPLTRKEFENIGLGAFGAVELSGTSPINTPIQCIYCITDIVLAAHTWKGLTGSFVGETLPAGTYLFGTISSITLTSGLGIGYKQSVNLDA